MTLAFFVDRLLIEPCYHFRNWITCLLGIILSLILISPPNTSLAEEIETGIGKFIVLLSSLASEPSPLLIGGAPVDINHPGIHLSYIQDYMRAIKKFMNTRGCLNFDADSEIVDLTRIATGKFDTVSELDTCLQWIARELDSPEDVRDWLYAIGFSSVEILQISYARFSYSGNKLENRGVAITASWYERSGQTGRAYPLSWKFNAKAFLFVKNLSLAIHFNKQDSIIDLRAGVIIL